MVARPKRKKLQDPGKKKKKTSFQDSVKSVTAKRVSEARRTIKARSKAKRKRTIVDVPSPKPKRRGK